MSFNSITFPRKAFFFGVCLSFDLVDARLVKWIETLEEKSENPDRIPIVFVSSASILEKDMKPFPPSYRLNCTICNYKDYCYYQNIDNVTMVLP